MTIELKFHAALQRNGKIVKGKQHDLIEAATGCAATDLHRNEFLMRK